MAASKHETTKEEICKYGTYEDYLDSLLLPEDIHYIHNIPVLRQLIEWKLLR